VADAKAGLDALNGALDNWRAPAAWTKKAIAARDSWQAVVDRVTSPPKGNALPSDAQVLGAVNRKSGPSDIMVCAAGGLPGELHKLWRTIDSRGYHLEYGFSCMGYEIAGGLGVKLADPEREVFVLVGDGSYLMMAQELVTAVQEGVKLNVVLVQNHGFASIGALSESLGSQRFGTRYRARNPRTGALDGDLLPVDLAANAASLGADVRRATTIEELEAALREARASDRCTVIEVQTDPLVATPSSEAWWDVPVAEVAGLESTRAARKTYEENKRSQRIHLTGSQAKTREEVTTP